MGRTISLSKVSRWRGFTISTCKRDFRIWGFGIK